MDPAQLDPNGDGGGRVVGSNSRRVDDTRVKPTPSQSVSSLASSEIAGETVDPSSRAYLNRSDAGTHFTDRSGSFMSLSSGYMGRSMLL
jgi:hypothetical protein